MTMTATPPPFLSYSANHEDVLLNRLFGAQQHGFFVDVGAAHLPAESWHLLPQSRTRMRQKEVDVAVDAEC